MGQDDPDPAYKNFFMHISIQIVPKLCLFFLSLFCTASFTQARLKVFVTIAPQAYLVERIAGSQAEVHILVQPGESEEAYQLTVQQRKDLSDAQLYFSLHLPFEAEVIKRLQKEQHKNPKGSLKIVDARQNIPLLPLEAGNCCTEHPKEEFDPHIWMNPLYMRIMASTIAESLSELDPLFAPFYHSNLVKLQADLSALDADIRALMTPVHGKTLLVFHPSYTYFVKAYGLKQWAIEQHGKEALPGDLKRLIEQAKKKKITALFVQPNFSTRSAETIAKGIGAQIVVLNPLEENYIAGMLSLAQKIAAALENNLSKASLPEDLYQSPKQP